MTQAVRDFLSNEERASKLVVEGAVGAVVVGFVVAIIAMFVLR